MNSITRQNLLALILPLAATLISVTVTGFQFGINNNVFHIPYVLRYRELEIFHNDAFYNSLEKFTSLIWPVLRSASTEENVEQVFFIAHFISRAVAFFGLSWFFIANCSARLGVLLLALTAVAICPWLRNASDFGGHGLFIGYFTHSEATWGPLIAGLVAAQLGRLRLAAAFTAIVFSINAFVGIWISLVIFATVATNLNQRRDWKLLIQSSSVFLLLCAPVLIWIIFAIKDKIASPDFSYIEYIRIYYPGHFLIESTPGHAIRNAAIITYCGFISAILGRHQKFWSIVLGVLVGLLLVGSILPYLLNNRFIFNLHLLRSAGVLQFLAVIISISASIEIAFESKNPAAVRAIAVLAGSSLITFQPEPLSLLFCAASLTFLAIIKLLDTRSNLTDSTTIISTTQINYFVTLLVVVAVIADLFHIGISLSTLARWVLVLSIIIAVILNNKTFASKVTLSILCSLLAALIITVTHKWKNSNPSETSIKSKTERAEMVQWVRESKLNGPFLFPVDSRFRDLFNEFQLVTKKPVWVDWKQGAAVMWEPSFYWQWMPRFEAVKSLKTSEELADYAVRNNIHHIVLPTAIGKCTNDFDTVFENKSFSICTYRPGQTHLPIL